MTLQSQPFYKTSDLPELWSWPNSFHWTFITDIDLCRVCGKIKILSKPCFSDLVKHNDNYPIPDNLMIFLVFRSWFNCIMDWQKLQSTDQTCGEPRRNLVTVSETDSNMTRWDGTFLIRSGLVDLNIKPGYWGDNHNSHPRHQSLNHTTKTQSSQGREKVRNYPHFLLTSWDRREEGGESPRPYRDINPISGSPAGLRNMQFILRNESNLLTPRLMLSSGVIRILLLNSVALLGR